MGVAMAISLHPRPRPSTSNGATKTAIKTASLPRYLEIDGTLYSVQRYRKLFVAEQWAPPRAPCGHVVVRTVACTLCASDVKAIAGDKSPNEPLAGVNYHVT